MQQLLQFQPIYQQRVWGGRAIESILGRFLPSGEPIGESWEIVDRPEAQSVVRGGKWEGWTLRALIEQHGGELMGPRWPGEKRFPILVKWLDCHERLSLQVHPPAAVAASLGGEPKTENWFIAQAAPGATLTVGLKRGVTREQFERALHEGKLESCVHRFPVVAGDSILVRSGQVHAIDGGNLILEIQQNSDTTYRIYDWGRVGLDGKPRSLHVTESLRSILWDDFEPAPCQSDNRPEVVLAEVAEFRIRRLALPKGGRLQICGEEQPRILSMVTGAVRLLSTQGVEPEIDEMGRGENAVLPFAAEFIFEATEAAVLLLTENFC